jgi:hypothetical protein
METCANCGGETERVIAGIPFCEKCDASPKEGKVRGAAVQAAEERVPVIATAIALSEE